MVMDGSDDVVEGGGRGKQGRAGIGVSACLTLIMQPKAAGSNSSDCMQLKLPIHTETLLLQLGPFLLEKERFSTV